MKTSIKNLMVMAVIAITLSACGGGSSSTPSNAVSANDVVVTQHVNYIPVDQIRYQDVYQNVGTGIAGSVSPKDLRSHYSVPDTATGAGQTIAIVDAPGSNNALTDLNLFSAYYKLPLCNTTNPCLTQYNMPGGVVPVKGSYNDWAGEIALDTQYAHGIAPNAKLLLVIAKSSGLGDMLAAVQYAATQPGVVVISMSWGAQEFTAENAAAYDAVLASIQAKGITLIASSGDLGNNGGNNEWPAASPNVTSIGGTTIKSTVSALPTPTTEVAWSLGGGGISKYEPMPAYQAAFISSTVKALDTGGKRLIPDVSYNADTVASPVCTFKNGAWIGSGGTSEGAPQWAAIVALIAEARANAKHSSMQAMISSTPGGFNGLLYNAKTTANAIFDVTAGSNDTSGKVCPICNEGVGYSAVDGLGVPNVANLITAFNQ